MTSFVPEYTLAEQLRKEKRYRDALPHFKTLWDTTPDPDVGWRYAHCLRKLGDLDQALSVARNVSERFPDHSFSRNEIAWALYDKEIKPAKEDSDYQRVTQAASEILGLTEDNLPRNKAILAVLKVAKNDGRWDEVLEWANLVEPEQLEVKPFIPSGPDSKEIMPDREIWYIAKVRALFELGHYDESQALALAAQRDYPDEFFLKRTAAMARAKSGDVQGGYEALVSLQHHPRADWYIYSDIAELELDRGRNREALQWLVKAMDNRVPLRNKVSVVTLIAQVALSLEMTEMSYDHIQLAISIREREGWPIKDKDRQLEQHIVSSMKSIGVAAKAEQRDIRKFEQACRNHWDAITNEGKKKLKGIVKRIPSDKKFTFISTDDLNEDVFVRVEDIPKQCRTEGARVEFYLEESFDKKKNRNSYRASRVTCVR